MPVVLERGGRPTITSRVLDLLHTYKDDGMWWSMEEMAEHLGLPHRVVRSCCYRIHQDYDYLERDVVVTDKRPHWTPLYRWRAGVSSPFDYADT